MNKITIFFALALCLSGCKSNKGVTHREVPVYIRDTVRVVQMHHDSIHVDRWHVELYKGDTVYISDTFMYVNYITNYDTVYCSVERPVEILIKKKKELNIVPKKLKISIITCLVVVTALGILRFFKKKVT